METINDIRREEGDSEGGLPNTRPVPVNRAFHNPGAVMRITATIVFVLGILITVLGIITFIIPIAIIGVLVLLASGFLFARARDNVFHT